MQAERRQEVSVPPPSERTEPQPHGLAAEVIAFFNVAGSRLEVPSNVLSSGLRLGRSENGRLVIANIQDLANQSEDPDIQGISLVELIAHELLRNQHMGALAVGTNTLSSMVLDTSLSVQVRERAFNTVLQELDSTADSNSQRFQVSRGRLILGQVVTLNHGLRPQAADSPELIQIEWEKLAGLAETFGDLESIRELLRIPESQKAAANALGRSVLREQMGDSRHVGATRMLRHVFSGEFSEQGLIAAGYNAVDIILSEGDVHASPRDHPALGVYQELVKVVNAKGWDASGRGFTDRLARLLFSSPISEAHHSGDLESFANLRPENLARVVNHLTHSTAPTREQLGALSAVLGAAIRGVQVGAEVDSIKLGISALASSKHEFAVHDIVGFLGCTIFDSRLAVAVHGSIAKHVPDILKRFPEAGPDILPRIYSLSKLEANPDRRALCEEAFLASTNFAERLIIRGSYYMHRFTNLFR